MRRLAVPLSLAFLFVGTNLQGAGIGGHVASVTPQHPLDEGRDFGECIAELAMTGECPHEHDL